MKYIAKPALLVSCLFLVSTGVYQAAEAPPPKSPVLILPYTRFEDYSHIPYNDDRVFRVLLEIEKLRKQYPGQPFKPVFQFSGAMSGAIGSEGSKGDIYGRLREGAAKGLIEYGYAGEMEPTPRNRPLPNLAGARTPEERWLARQQAARQFLEDYKDAVTGNSFPGLTGGLKRAQEVFGPAALISGLSLRIGGDSPFMRLLETMNKDAVIWGFPDPDPVRGIEAYASSAAGASRILSPAPDTSPELFWEDNYLHSSDFGFTDLHHLSTTQDIKTFKESFSKLDRSRIRVIHLEYGSYLRYLNSRDGVPLFPPLEWIWDHPQQPAMPTSLHSGAKANDIETAFEIEEAAMRWLFEEFLPANPGSRFVSASELKSMADQPLGKEFGAEEISLIARDLLDRTRANGNRVADFAAGSESYFSLADSFNLLTQALAQRKAAAPGNPKVRLTRTYGPLGLVEGQGAVSGEVKGESIASVAAELAPRFSMTSDTPVPSNTIPMSITVDGVFLNSAQFLNLLARAYLAKSLDERFQVEPCIPRSVSGELYPHNVDREDMGNVWTLRPARLRIPGTPAEHLPKMTAAR